MKKLLEFLMGFLKPESIVDIIVKVLRNESIRALAKESPDVVIDAIVLVRPVLDELQDIADDEKARRAAMEAEE